MKKPELLLAGLFFLCSFQIQAQTCTTVLDDDFSSNSGWTQVGGGTVSVTGGVCSFNNTYAGVDDRIHKTLPVALSNTYWKAECKVTFNGQNPNGNGAGAELLSLTAGTLPFMTYDASQSFQETVQDGISVVITSTSAADEDRDNWFFLTEAKLGNNRTYNLASSIYASSAISVYYLRLERTATGMTQMSVCTDAAFTQHMPGSPSQFAINPAISGLNVIQHASNPPGTATRMFNGSIDDDYVCHDVASCNLLLVDNFATNSGWTQVGGGTVNVASGVCNFNTTYAGVDDRVYKTLPTTLSNTYWKAECKITFNGQNPNGNGTGAELLSLTAGTLPFMTYDASQSFQETVQDGLSVVITSANAADEDRDNWFFLTESKLGNSRTYTLASSVYASSTISTYYLRLERTAAGMSQMSVCTDSLFTQHLPGSPSQHAINPAISGLSVIQHASNPPGTATRMFNGTIDNDVVCHDGSVGLEELFTTTVTDATVYPNPAGNSIRTSVLTANQLSTYSIFAMDGKVLQNGIMKSDGTIDISQLAEGSYLLVIMQDEKAFRSKFIKAE